MRTIPRNPAMIPQRLGLVLAGALALAAACAWPAMGSVAVGVRGLTGCWELVEEDARVLAGVATRRRSCLAPSDDGSELISRSFEGDVLVRETVWHLDGRRVPNEGPGCSGWKTARLSSDGRRIYTRAETSCESDESIVRTGVILVMSRETRLDVEVVALGRSRDVSTRVHHSISGNTVRLPDALPAEVDDARLLASSFNAADVVEALEWVDPVGVEAMLIELRPRFGMNSRLLLELGEAEVPERIVDLMVALSFPDRFVVERHGVRRATPVSYYRHPYYLGSRWWPYYGYRWWWWGGGYYPYPPVVLPPETRGGRVIAGQGYTRVTSAGGGVLAGGDGGGGASGGGGGSGGGSVSAAGHHRRTDDSPAGPVRRARPR